MTRSFSAGIADKKAVTKERRPKMKASSEISRKVMGEVVEPVGLTLSAEVIASTPTTMFIVPTINWRTSTLMLLKGRTLTSPDTPKVFTILEQGTLES